MDIEDHFKPTYEPLAARKKTLTALRKYAKSAPLVFLATDLDREGEAIAWHLAQVLKIPKSRLRRVVFNEITATAVREAFANAHGLDMDKVHAQQARRILDRLVGYQVSPLLWKKVARGLSAGRVQSVAVRLIVERERDIEAFDPEEYWRIGGIFTTRMKAAPDIAERWWKFCAKQDEKGRPPTQEARQYFLAGLSAFTTQLVRWKGEKFEADNAEAVLEVVDALGMTVDSVDRTEDPDGRGAAANLVNIVARLGESSPQFTVTDVAQRDRQSKPPAPFTTAALQQSAAVRLHFSASRTMRVAQQLYEGVELPGEGSVGLITYMRTDSTHLSNEAVGHVRTFIGEVFGTEYLPEKPRRFASGGRAQEAHEAIRPTVVGRTPDRLRGTLKSDQLKLYELIWKRFVACQMSPAIWKVGEATITAKTLSGTGEFKALGQRLDFEGYLKVAGPPRGGDQALPSLSSGQLVAPVDIQPRQHFTQPPPRYTEASLVKALEADGIGRPSTYASIIRTIQDRTYVRLQDRSFRPTHLGMVVTDKLVKHLPGVFDVRFTAHMEDELDRVEEAKVQWVEVLENFYGPFHKNLEKAAEEMVHAKAESQPSEYKCDECGKPMVYRFNRNGRYLACTGYPDCKHTVSVDEDGKKVEKQVVDVACPKCGQPMLLRKGRYGPFLSCLTYPECDGVVNLDRKGFIKLPAPPPLQVDLPCPKCEAPLNLRRSKRGPWLACSKFPKCRGRQGWKALTDDQQKDLELQLLNHEKANPVPALRDTGGNPIGDRQQPQPLEPSTEDGQDK